MTIHFLWLLLAFGLVFLNAFFVAAEFGMVKLRQTRIQTIKKNYGFRGRILAQIHQHLDVYLSACQLGITLASLGLGWVGEPAFAYLLEPIFNVLGVASPKLLKLVAFFTAFTLLSFLHIVIGELMPKSLAIRQSETVSIWTAVPLYVFYWLMCPAIWFLNTCSNFLLKRTKLDTTSKTENFYSTDEIKLILSSSHLHGELTKDETEIIEHTLDFADLKATDVMRPREEMINLDIHQPIQELLQTVLQHRFSRYPVYDKKIGEVIGIVHVKDLFAALYQDQKLTQITTLIRPVLKISYRLQALKLLRKFREGQSHFALVYSRSDILVGFVTLDNLLHVLIGRIKDEFHKTQDDWVRNTDGSLTVKGECSIYSLEQALDRNIELDTDEEIETLAGLIIFHLGSIPKQGQIIELPKFSVKVEKVSGSRIQQVTIYLKPLI